MTISFSYFFPFRVTWFGISKTGCGSIDFGFICEFLFFQLLLKCAAKPMPLAILHMEGLHGTADVCAQYNPHYSSIPKTLKETVS